MPEAARDPRRQARRRRIALSTHGRTLAAVPPGSLQRARHRHASERQDLPALPARASPLGPSTCGSPARRKRTCNPPPPPPRHPSAAAGSRPAATGTPATASASGPAAASPTGPRPRLRHAVPLRLEPLHQRLSGSRARQAQGSRRLLGSHRLRLGRDRGHRQGRAQLLVHRDDGHLRQPRPGARDQRPDDALAHSLVGARRGDIEPRSPDEPSGLLRLRTLGRQPLAGPRRRLGGLERARSEPVVLPGHGRAVRITRASRLPGLQGRRPERARRPRRPFLERRCLAEPALRARRKGFLRRRRHPPVPGHGRRAARDRRRRPPLVVHAHARRPRGDGRKRRRREADLVHRVRLVRPLRTGPGSPTGSVA